jgi:chaperonin GroES
MNIKPLHDNVLIQPLVKEEKTESGIYIPETASKEKPQQGEVVAVGAGKDGKKMSVKVGDKVLFAKYGLTEVSIDGKEYLIGEEKEVLAVIG